MDNRHHWQDVSVGSIVGLVFSYFAYRQYYPSLSAEDAHIPFEPRFLGRLRPPFPGSGSSEEGRRPTSSEEGLNGTGRGRMDNFTDDIEVQGLRSSTI